MKRSYSMDNFESLNHTKWECKYHKNLTSPYASTRDRHAAMSLGAAQQPLQFLVSENSQPVGDGYLELAGYGERVWIA
jgi:hypothetical protein